MNVDLSHKTVVILVTEDWSFLSHRLSLAKALRDAGARVIVVSNFGIGAQAIQREGFEHLPVIFDRKGINPFTECKTVFQIWGHFRRVKPDLVFHVALKPIVYGCLASLIPGLKGHKSVHLVTGLGYMFTATGMKPYILRKVIQCFLKIGFMRSRTSVIFQNPDDRHLFLQLGVLKTVQTFIVPGSGVDTQKFLPQPSETSDVLTITLPARMLWDKGVREAVEAMQFVAKQNLRAILYLVGPIDESNPSSIPQSTLLEWVSKNANVRWVGQQSDMPGIFAKSDIVILPSYREGLPLALIEAASSGKPLIASDTPGCREVVRDGQNGLLVPAKNARALADAIIKLISDSDLRDKFGKFSRRLALDVFDARRINLATLEIAIEPQHSL